MSDKTTAWNNLDMKTKAWVIEQAVRGGISKDLEEIKQLYNEVDSLNNVAKQQNPNIIQRLNQNNLKTIEDWEDPKSRASHKIGSYDNRVIGIVQQDSTGNLIDYSNPINHKGSNMWDAAIKSAEQNKDYVEFSNPEHAGTYGQFYKLAYPQHFMPTKKYDDGGPTDDVVYYGGNLPEVTVVGKKRDPLGLSWKDIVNAGGLSDAVALGETALDFTPIIGDAKGLTYDVYKGYEDAGWKGVGITAGLGLLGLVPMFGDTFKKIGNPILNKLRKVNQKTSDMPDFDITQFHPLTKSSYSYKIAPELEIETPIPYYGTTSINKSVGEPDYLQHIRDFYVDTAKKISRNEDNIISEPSLKGLFNTPISVYKIPENSKLLGVYSPGNIAVTRGSKIPEDEIIVHELAHEKQHEYMPENIVTFIDPDNATKLYTETQKNYLNSAYKFSEDFIEQNKGIHKLLEKGASNTQMRYLISKSNGNALGKDLDTIIDNLSPKDVVNLLNTSNSYTRDFLQSLMQTTGKNAEEAVALNLNTIKNALKYVPAITGAAVGAQMVGNNEYRFGGPKGGEYNIFEDPESFEGRDQHRKSLDTFVKNNPKLYGLNTADFVDFLSQIAGLESGYRSGATTDASTYSGYYGLKNGHTFDVDTQHKKAFQHLASIFKENITKQDIDKAISLGITPSQLLAKYWNQGNRVTNYLYNGTGNTDALGTKISKYGWNVTAPVEYKHLVPEGITQDFVLVENAKSLTDATKLARNQYIDYSNRDAYIKKVNVERYKNKKRNPKFIDTKLQVGDTIFLTPMNVPTINKK